MLYIVNILENILEKLQHLISLILFIVIALFNYYILIKHEHLFIY